MKRRDLSYVVAGGLATAVFATVEIWVTELAPWVFHRASFSPLDGLFAVALFVLYPATGALAAGLIGSGLIAMGHRPDPRAVAASIVVVLHASCVVSHLAGGALLFAASLDVFLLGAALVSASSRPRGARVLALLRPWTLALLLLVPLRVATHTLDGASWLARAVGTMAVAAALVALSRIRFSGTGNSTSVTVATATLAAVVLAGPAAPRERLTPRELVRPAGPNVLFVTLDTVRADRLSVYGSPLDTTPGLRRFAESATVYRRAVAPSNMTLASHASFFTGLAASQHRAHYDVGRPAGRPLGTGIPTLAEIFASRGFEVSSVAANFGFLGSGFGLDRGFSWVDALPRRSTLGMIEPDSVRGFFRRFLCRTLRVWPDKDTRTRSADEITDHALERIAAARAHARPFFLFVNYFDAHERVVPPGRPRSFGAASVSASGLFDTLLKEMNRRGRVTVDPGVREDLLASYDEALAYLDACLSRVLARSGDDTLVIVTSDHGEAFGEHESIGHGSTVYPEQVLVPLLVREPGQKEKRVIEEPVGLAGLFDLATGRSAAPDGSSLAITESFPLVPTFEKPGIRGGRALFRDDAVLLKDAGGRLELYDARGDAGETRDLAEVPAETPRRDALAAELDRWVSRHPPSRSAESSETEEGRARLRSLGYLR